MGHITCLSHLDVLRELEAPLSAGRDRVQPLMEMAQYGLWGLSAGGGGTASLLASEIPCRTLSFQNTQKLKMGRGNPRLPERLGTSPRPSPELEM